MLPFKRAVSLRSHRLADRNPGRSSLRRLTRLERRSRSLRISLLARLPSRLALALKLKELLCDVFGKHPAAFRTLMIASTEPKERSTSVMRYEVNPLNQATIGALQDCLLSARPR